MANIYIISQEVNKGYDTFDSAVVAARNEDEARNIHPSGNIPIWLSEWCPPEYVKVQFLSKAPKALKPGTIICASYNAGQTP